MKIQLRGSYNANSRTHLGRNPTIDTLRAISRELAIDIDMFD
jgi:hypothetical protein